jgi:hypothetical protein
MLTDDIPAVDPGLPSEIHQLLDEIAAQPVPERLLELALELQAALQARRVATAKQGESAASAF